MLLSPKKAIIALMAFVYITSPLFLEHITGDHPENRQRLEVINREVEKLIPRSKWIEPRAATTKEISAIHTPKHIELIRSSCEAGAAYLDLDTPISPKSYLSAVKAVGAGCTAVEMLQNGEAEKAFCAVRPPGHHAESDRAMGFCLFNNIAVSAKHAQRLGAKRVAIVDFDVHHGNGTQHSFESDPTILFASFHHWGIYPGTGSADEKGLGEGEGATINYPLAGMTGDAEYLSIMEESLLPKLKSFKPDILLISAGFDTHESDPLGGMGLTDNGFREMTKMLKHFADNHCEGKLVSFLEGGYNLQTLGATVAVHIKELIG